MNYIESSKSYTGDQLESVFFRPMLTGESAEDFGIRVLYNMPVPTTVHLWGYSNDVLNKNVSGGWTGTSRNIDSQCQIDMQRVKAELGFSAADYYSLVFENMSLQDEVNLDDLTGTTLEKVETELFSDAITESIRSTMWVGNTSRNAGLHSTFNGFLTKLAAYITSEDITPVTLTEDTITKADETIELFDKLWDTANSTVQDAKASGKLVFYVTSDIYNLYEKYLDSAGVDTSYVDKINGRSELRYHGIPVIDMRVSSLLGTYGPSETIAFLTMRDNLVMAVNTADFPGSEIKMWYNPDEMENRQRAIFAIGCEVLDPSLVTMYVPED